MKYHFTLKKLSLLLITLSLLSSAIFSSKLNKIKAQTESQTEALVQTEAKTEAKTKHADLTDPIHTTKQACDDFKAQFNNNKCFLTDQTTCDPDPLVTCTKNCRDPRQRLGWFWTNIGSQFNDLGVNSEGAIVAIGADGNLYYYQYDMNVWELIQGDFVLYNLARVDVGFDGLIYVTNLSGDTYYLTCNRFWVKLPGCARDIGTGRGHEVAKIGCNECENKDSVSPCTKNLNPAHEGAYARMTHIYKLHCDCDCRCCHRKCNIFIKFVYTCEKDIDRHCYWLKYPQIVLPRRFYPSSLLSRCNHSSFKCIARRVDVNASGKPMAIVKCQYYFRRWITLFNGIVQMVGNHKNNWIFIRHRLGVTFRDLCGDNYGNIIYTYRRGLYSYIRIYDEQRGGVLSDHWIRTHDRRKTIRHLSCGPYAQPTYSDSNCEVYTNSKVRYN